MNEKNLKKGNPPTQFRSGREAVENGQKGGIKSGEVRREQKTYRELAKSMLAAPITDKAILKELRQYGIEETDLKAYTLLGLIKACGKGSHNAFDRILELTGENDAQTGAKQFNDGLAVLADLINNPAPNRNIADFEEKDNA